MKVRMPKKGTVESIVEMDGSVRIGDTHILWEEGDVWRKSVRSLFDAVLKRVRYGTPILCRVDTYAILCECRCGQLGLINENCSGDWSVKKHLGDATQFVMEFVRGMNRMVHHRRTTVGPWPGYTDGFRSYIRRQIKAYQQLTLEVPWQRNSGDLVHIVKQPIELAWRGNPLEGIPRKARKPACAGHGKQHE